MVSPQARREQVAFACERGLPERRACRLLDIARSALGYELRLPARDRPVIEAMKLLSSQYLRYGYWRTRSSWSARGISSAGTARSGCGARRGRSCRIATRGGAPPLAGHDRCLRPVRVGPLPGGELPGVRTAGVDAAKRRLGKIGMCSLRYGPLTALLTSDEGLWPAAGPPARIIASSSRSRRCTVWPASSAAQGPDRAAEAAAD
jgi:hypothetical protein